MITLLSCPQHFVERLSRPNRDLTLFYRLQTLCLQMCKQVVVDFVGRPQFGFHIRPRFLA